MLASAKLLAIDNSIRCRVGWGNLNEEKISTFADNYVSAPRDTVWLYYHISAILKTIKYCRKRPEAPHLFPGYSFGSILLEDFLPRASVLPAAPDDTGDPVPAYA